MLTNRAYVIGSARTELVALLPPGQDFCILVLVALVLLGVYRAHA